MKISFVAITLLSLILKEVLCQTCKVYNQENNLLTMAVNETFRLPLNNYFIGEGLQYELSNNSGFTLAQQQWGPSEINGTIISTTSVQFNNNLNIVTFQYFALVSQNNEYQILGSNITMDPLLVTYSNILNTINNATCYTINYVQGQIFVTCSIMNNGLVFYFYQLNGVFQQSYSYPQIIVSNNSVITTQTNFNYMILLINEGQIVNGSYISSFSKIYSFPYIQITPPEAAPTPHILSGEGGNYFTGISITDQNILFIAKSIFQRFLTNVLHIYFVN